MTSTPDDFAWISEKEMLELCELPRSTLRSWEEAGLSFIDPGGAYGEGAVLEIALAVAIRKNLGLKETIGAWRQLRKTGALDAYVNAARVLQEGDCFDLVVEPKSAAVSVAQDDEALIDAVRHPDHPRPVVVRPMAKRLVYIRDAFERLRRVGPRPAVRQVGRPRRHADVHSLPGGTS